MVKQGSDVLDDHKSNGGVATEEGVDSGQHGSAYNRSGQVVALEAKGALVKVIAGLALVGRQKYTRVLVLDKSSLHADKVATAGVCAATIASVDACSYVSVPLKRYESS